VCLETCIVLEFHGIDRTRTTGARASFARAYAAGIQPGHRRDRKFRGAREELATVHYSRRQPRDISRSRRHRHRSYPSSYEKTYVGDRNAERVFFFKWKLVRMKKKTSTVRNVYLLVHYFPRAFDFSTYTRHRVDNSATELDRVFLSPPLPNPLLSLPFFTFSLSLSLSLFFSHS